MLCLLVLADLAWILFDLSLWTRGPVPPLLNIEADGSLPEWFNYAKWAASLLACGYAFSRRGQPLYLLWSVLFAYLLLDDAALLHERVGEWLAAAYDVAPAFALRGQDIGELVTSLVAASILLVPMAVLYLRAGSRARESAGFTLRLLPWLGVLALCGIAIDMLHVQTGGYGSIELAKFLGVLEDGGEMIAASVLAGLSVCQATSIRSTVDVSLEGR